MNTVHIRINGFVHKKKARKRQSTSNTTNLKAYPSPDEVLLWKLFVLVTAVTPWSFMLHILRDNQFFLLCYHCLKKQTKCLFSPRFYNELLIEIRWTRLSSLNWYETQTSSCIQVDADGFQHSIWLFEKCSDRNHYKNICGTHIP